jgi:hypothetical protein
MGAEANPRRADRDTLGAAIELGELLFLLALL